MRKIPNISFSNLNISKEMWRLIGIMVLAILIVAALARTLGHSETLADYATKHPELQIEATSSDESDTSTDAKSQDSTKAVTQSDK